MKLTIHSRLPIDVGLDVMKKYESVELRKLAETLECAICGDILTAPVSEFSPTHFFAI